MSTPFSPGPWKAVHGVVSDKHGYYITRDVRPGNDSDQVVCRMDGSTMMGFARDANMPLIAAAPEMHEMLMTVLHGVPVDPMRIFDLLHKIEKGGE
jgi:hypothetical protein